jgi:glucosamine--fructose-6-phosphate aminotransferase (isomerizing)
MTEDIIEFGGKILVITNKKLNLSARNFMQIFLDEPDEYLFSIQSVIPVQLFIDSYAKSKGFEAGSFSRGSKVTTIE